MSSRFWLLLALCAGAWGCGDVEEARLEPVRTCGDAETDATRVIPESPEPRPELGIWQLDPDLGGCLGRVSDHADQQATTFRASPTRQAWNADGTLLSLESGHVLDATAFEVVAHVAVPSVWRGSYTRYRVEENRLLLVDLWTGTENELARFDEYSELDASLLADPSQDGRHLLLVGRRASDGGNELFVWDTNTRRKSPTSAVPFDAVGRAESPSWVMLSPSGRFVIVGWSSPGTGPFRGIELFDANLARVAKLSDEGGDADVLLDADGTEWLIHESIGEEGLVLERIRLGATPMTRTLLELDWFQAVRVSCRAAGRASCVIATHGDPSGSWQPFSNEVFELFLDSTPEAPHVARHAHHRSAPEWVSSHAATECELSPQAVLPNPSLSRDGSTVLFTSNWGQHCFGELYLIRR